LVTPVRVGRHSDTQDKKEVIHGAIHG